MYHCYLTVLSLILTACCSDRLAVVGVACGLAPVGRWCLASYPVTNPLGEVGRSAKQQKEANRSGWPLSRCSCSAFALLVGLVGVSVVNATRGGLATAR